MAKFKQMCSACKRPHSMEYDTKKHCYTLVPLEDCANPSIQGPGTPGELYRPSNGTEGDYFIERYCVRCYWYDDESRCPIYEGTQDVDLTDPAYPSQWRVGENGWGICSSFLPDDGRIARVEKQDRERAAYEAAMRAEPRRETRTKETEN